MKPIVTPITPLPVMLRGLIGFPPNVEVLIKDETANPGGSSKARVAHSLISEGVQTGRITAGTEVVLASSGSTAIAMANETRPRGLSLRVFLPRVTPRSKVAALRGYAHVLIDEIPGSSEDARLAADQYVASAAAVGSGVWLADQYNLPAGPRAHALGTAAEILQQTKGLVTHVVVGIGTGCTATGLAMALRRLSIGVVGVEPQAPVHGLAGLKYTPSLPPHLMPSNLRLDLLSEVQFIGDKEAFGMTQLLIRHGFRFGPSTGAVCAAARDFAARLAGKPAHLVLIGHDSADHYPEFGEAARVA